LQLQQVRLALTIPLRAENSIAAKRKTEFSTRRAPKAFLDRKKSAQKIKEQENIK